MPESLKAESLSNYTSSAKLPSDYYEFSLSIKYEDVIANFTMNKSNINVRDYLTQSRYYTR